MAEALRRVSQNYNWTIKRAHNDLHEAIYSQPQTPITFTCGCRICEYSPGVLDPNRLRWKFGTEYEELREHLGHSFLILLTWVVTVLHLLSIGTRYTITNPIRSVIHIKQLGLATLLISPMSMWHLWVTLVRSTASLILSLLREIFDFYLSLDAKAGIRDKAGARLMSWLVGQRDSAHVPVGRSQSPESAVKVHADNISSGLSPSQPAASFAKDLKGGIESIRIAMLDKATQLSRRKTQGNNDSEGHHDAPSIQPGPGTTHGNTTRVGSRVSPKRPSPGSHRGVAKVIVIPPLTYDVSTMGAESPLAHNLDYFTL